MPWRGRSCNGGCEVRRAEALIAAAILAGSAALIFTRLSHYAFWNDEAYTALLAKSVWRTGDTHAILGHNLLAFQGGAALENLRHRFDPPLAYYLAAPFLGILGDSPLAGRLPFALCGLATVALMVWWAWRSQASRLTWLVLAIAVLGNVSLMLYSRQCRYYAPAMLLSTALAYLYLHWNGGRRGLAAMAAVSVCLLATNYINYAAFYACAAVDYLAWGRKWRRFSRYDLLALLTPQVVIGGLIVFVWNPLGRPVVPHESASWLADKATLLWWNVRDLSRCEFGVALLLLAAPVLCIARRCPALRPPSLSGRGKGEGQAPVPTGETHPHPPLSPGGRGVRTPLSLREGAGGGSGAGPNGEVPPSPHPLPGRERGWGREGARWLLRGSAALWVYVVATTLLSPEPVRGPLSPQVADVRYLVPLIPLCIVLGVMCVDALVRRAPALAVPLAILAFGTNLLQLGPPLGDPVRSTAAEFVSELARPRTTAYGAAAAWINANVAEGESVLVSPVDVASPLIFHAPKPVYAWQLRWPPEPQFRGLPDIHFTDREAPDYIIAFGRAALPPGAALRDWQRKGWRYRMADTLHVYWCHGPATDGTRPELFWHAFRPVAHSGHEAEAIYVFRRVR